MGGAQCALFLEETGSCFSSRHCRIPGIPHSMETEKYTLHSKKLKWERAEMINFKGIGNQ
jgi:hypothetical protein